MPAPTYVPDGRVGWWGGPDQRVRCLIDNKVVLELDRARKIAAQTDMSAYTGKCGHIHVGHGKQGRL